MLTEISQTFFNVIIQGRVVAINLPSRQLAEATLLQLPPEQRMLAEIVPVTNDGKQVLFG
jgi:hypothetical protein